MHAIHVQVHVHHAILFCEFKSTSNDLVEICIFPVADMVFCQSAPQISCDVEMQDWIEEEFFENERFQPFRGFGSTFPGHLLPTDRNRWSDRSGTMLVSTTTTTQDNEDFFGVAPRAPRGWCFVDDWRVDITGLAEHRVDEDGWSYAFDFTFLEFPPSVNSNKATTTTFVRRRRWTRHRVPVAKLQNEFQKHGNHSTPLESMPAATKAVSSQSLKLIAVARDADIKVWSGSAYICSERSLFGGFTYIDPGARAHAQSASCLVFGFPSTSQFVSVKMLNWVLLLFQSPSWKPVSSCAA